MTARTIRAIKQERPLYTWFDCLVCWYRMRQESLEPMPWMQIGYGLIVVCLGLVILSQVIKRNDSENWVCTRSGYAAVWIKDRLTPAVPCAEETHVRTGEVRVTAYGKFKGDSQ